MHLKNPQIFIYRNQQQIWIQNSAIKWLDIILHIMYNNKKCIFSRRIKMKVAIIGCGTIANNAHIPAYINNQDAEIKYFCDIIPERAEAAVSKYGLGTAITDYHTAIEDPEITAISVCTPNYCHQTITIDALRAGKHVLCEKPAARTYAEAKQMQEVQHETGKTLNIGVVNRFNTNVNRMKALIDSGELGEIYHVYASFRSHRSIPGLGGAFTTKDVAGGGVLIDWGVHFLDIIMYCCSDPTPTSASSETFSKLGSPIEYYKYVDMWAGPPVKDGIFDVEESITGLVRTTGPVITFNGAWAQNIGENEMFIDFMGTKGGIRLKYGADFTLYSTKGDALTETKFSAPGSNHFQNEIDAFVDCIKTGKKLPSHIDYNILTSAMMEAIYKSASEHKEIKI